MKNKASLIIYKIIKCWFTIAGIILPVFTIFLKFKYGEDISWIAIISFPIFCFLIVLFMEICIIKINGNMVRCNIKRTLNVDIKKVWETVLDLNDYSWRSDIEKIEIIDENNFIEYTKSGFKSNFKTTVIEQYKRWEFDIENENIEGHWVGVFDEFNGKTTIDFTENIKPKKWYLIPFMTRYLLKQQAKYCLDLKGKLEGK